MLSLKIVKSIAFSAFGLLLVVSLLSLATQAKGSDDSFVSWHGSEKIRISEKFDGSAPLEQCIESTDRILSEFDELLDGLTKLVIHTDTSKRRGLSDGKIIYIRCLEDSVEFENVLIHEVGHVVDLSYLKGTQSSKDSSFDDFGSPVKMNDPSQVYYGVSWQSTSVKNTHSLNGFVSMYSQSDPFEDFAETFLMYVRHGEIFRYLAFTQNDIDLKKKYVFIKTEVFNGKEFQLGSSLGLNLLRNLRDNYTPVFDMTKMHNLV
jgi:hypothetical protein